MDESRRTLSNPAPTTEALIRIERIEPTLRGAARRLFPAQAEGAIGVLLLESGALRFDGRDEEAPLQSPLGYLTQVTQREVLFFAPGTSGWLIRLSPNLMSEAIGHGAESGLLFDFLAGTSLVHPSPGRLASDYMPLAERISAEVRHPNAGSQMALVAWLRLLLIAFWRDTVHDDNPKAPLRGEADVIRHFRRLVERHFRRQIGVTEYAGLLGISYDRLHGICVRHLGRTPLQLVHQRVLRDALVRVERTQESIVSISDALGFSDAGNFTRFFKRAFGQSPAQWRTSMRRESMTSPQGKSYADWP